MWRLAAILAFALAAAAFVVLRTGPPPEPPNILLVTIDTLRADAVGKGKGTPAMEGFLSEATRFLGARTVAPLTLPAHASMFTGLLPARHRIHDNVSEPLPPRGVRPFPLLAEEMRDKGYATAAFVSCSVLGEATGIASGFDTFDCPPGLEGWSHGGSSPGDERAAAAARWIAEAPAKKPWFVWVHLFDPHKPYGAFAGDAGRPAVRESDPLPALYMGGVRRADVAFERLLAAAGPDAVVILVSDHGEGLMEHDESEHGPLCYGSTVDAVLAVRGPGFRRGAEDRALRSVADVAPTVRALSGIPAREGDGADLLGPPHAMLVTESLYTWRIHGWGQCFAVADGAYTLVESGPRLELFDKRSDPGETRPLPLSDPAYERLDRELERFRAAEALAFGGDMISSLPAYGSVRRRVSGYLPRHENAHLLDTRANLKDWMALETLPLTIRTSITRRDPAPLVEALRRLGELEGRWPTSPRVSQYRGMALSVLADLTRDRSYLRQAVWAQIQAVEKGYVDKETIRPAVSLSIAAPDRDALRSLIQLLARVGYRPDADTARALEEAAAALGIRGEPLPAPR
ncbi:MAG TPA: sulfatase-like hydrolase/transferase [Planctomycetota bacterium]|nr:sulfatase-like hydrolase/transferase [Planctomycetota bacterium]